MFTVISSSLKLIAPKSHFLSKVTSSFTLKLNFFNEPLLCWGGKGPFKVGIANFGGKSRGNLSWPFSSLGSLCSSPLSFGAGILSKGPVSVYRPTLGSLGFSSLWLVTSRNLCSTGSITQKSVFASFYGWVNISFALFCLVLTVVLHSLKCESNNLTY